MLNAAMLWKKGIFRRLVVTFILIIFPVYLIGTGIYYSSISAVKKEISGSVENELTYYLVNFNKELDRIKLLQSDLINSSVLYKLSTIPESMNLYNKTESILSVQERLFAIKNSSKYIKNVEVYIPLLNMTISSASGASTASEEDIDNYKSNYNKSSTGFIIWKNRVFLSFLYPIEYMNKSGLPPFVVSLEMDINELKRALNQLNHNDSSGTVLLNPSQNFAVFASNNIKNYDEVNAYYKNISVKNSPGALNIKIDGRDTLMFYAYSSNLDLLLLKHIAKEAIFSKMDILRDLLWLLSIVSLIIIVVFSYIIFKNIHQPILKLVQSFRKVENGDLNISIEHKHDDEFSYLYKGFVLMVNKLKNLIEQVYEQKILAQKAELKYLQSQINPHFLYNSFFIINNMVESEDYENTKLFSKQLGAYFQYITRSVSDEVSLGKEVMHARTYSEIQARRFRNRIKLEFAELPAEFENMKVPRLILQPIIENAFEHGLENILDKGIVRVEFYRRDELLVIEIQDNGQGMTAEEINALRDKMYLNTENTETTGIINVHRRIQMMLGSSSGVEVGSGDIGGLKVSIQLAIRGEQQYDKPINR